MLKFLMLLLTLPLCSIALAEDVKSVWAPAPPTIDGDGDEWRDIAFNYFDGDQTAIAVANDSAASDAVSQTTTRRCENSERPI